MTTPLIEAIAASVVRIIDTCPAVDASPSRIRKLRSDMIAQAALTAIAEQGMVIVPREPTQDMISAGIIERHDQPTPEAWSLATENIYRAMISAAQGDGA